MNYRHDFHAGNFADVFKHVILTRALLYFMRKPAPFRFIDTHAGSGRYDLASAEAARTQEWRGGIGRLDFESMDAQVRDLLTSYRNIVGLAAEGEGCYPGSPALALAMMRAADRLLFCELHPAALDALKTMVGRDRRTKVIAMDGYAGLNAFLPPVERRGLILVDPPFEKDDEFETLANGLVAAWRKWRDGVFMAWYPIKTGHGGVERLVRRLGEAGVSALRLELQIADPGAAQKLVANGLIIINPPFALEQEAACLLPTLSRQLAAGRGDFRIGWIKPSP